jgi:hypothetical protein
MTALGAVRLDRSYASCPACRQGNFPTDPLLGVEGWLTRRALAMACRAGVADPFRKAELLLTELAGWSVDADTLRRRCHEQAAAAQAARAQRTALPDAFATAAGERELHIDAGKVNTVENGWRDVKVAAFACRVPGEPSTTADLQQRHLPAPSVRALVAAVEERGAFGERVEAEALRLRVPLGVGLSVLGDGAEWIWNLAADHFHGATQVLDVWHGAEKLAEAGRQALGSGPALQPWLEQAKAKLVGDGYAGVCEVLATPLTDAAAQGRLQEAAGAVLNYFAGHQRRLGYAVRLRRGQVIGSGLVEGSIKQMVNLRMKRTGARWRLAQVGPFVEFVALAEGSEWHEHWRPTLAA